MILRAIHRAQAVLGLAPQPCAILRLAFLTNDQIDRELSA